LKNTDHIFASLQYLDKPKKASEPMEIKLFDNYIHLIGFDEHDMKHRKGKHTFFELEFFSDNLLIGENPDHKGKVIFERS
jgi:hypothetical protein